MVMTDMRGFKRNVDGHDGTDERRCGLPEMGWVQMLCVVE